MHKSSKEETHCIDLIAVNKTCLGTWHHDIHFWCGIPFRLGQENRWKLQRGLRWGQTIGSILVVIKIRSLHLDTRKDPTSAFVWYFVTATTWWAREARILSRVILGNTCGHALFGRREIMKEISLGRGWCWFGRTGWDHLVVEDPKELHVICHVDCFPNNLELYWLLWEKDSRKSHLPTILSTQHFPFRWSSENSVNNIFKRTASLFRPVEGWMMNDMLLYYKR